MLGLGEKSRVDLDLYNISMHKKKYFIFFST